MSTAPEVFSHQSVQRAVEQGVQQVFATMMGIEVSSAMDQTIGELPVLPMSYFAPETALVAGIVGFLGDLNGVVYLYMSESLAAKITSALLRISPEEVDDEGFDMINDALGEVCNVIVGFLKTQFCDGGGECRMTIPSIVRGNHLFVEATAEIIRYSFAMRALDEVFVLETIIKP